MPEGPKSEARRMESGGVLGGEDVFLLTID